MGKCPGGWLCIMHLTFVNFHILIVNCKLNYKPDKRYRLANHMICSSTINYFSWNNNIEKEIPLLECLGSGFVSN